MLLLKAQIRPKFGGKTKGLRDKKNIPAILYGPKIENIPLIIDAKEFKLIYGKTGESSLISLEVSFPTGSEKVKKFLVLVHQLQKDPLTENLRHIDFYQPILTEEVEVSVPLLFEGESLAIKELGGTLIKEMQEVMVKALPQDLPHEIKVNINGLKTFEDEILIKDLQLPENVKIQRDIEEIVATVSPPGKVEEELKEPLEEEKEEETAKEEIKEEETEEKRKEKEKKS